MKKDEVELDELDEELDDEDEFDLNSFDDFKEFYRRDNGNRLLNPAKIFGTLIGTIAVVAHIIHTFASNVLFGKYEQLAIREAFMRGLGKLGKPGEISADENEHKTANSQEHETTNIPYTVQKANIPDHTLERESNIDDKDIAALNKALNNPAIQHSFILNGYLTDTLKNEAFLLKFNYQEGKIENSARSFQASEFYSRNLNGMSHAIQELEHISEIEAALKSCSLYAGMVIQMNNNEKNDLAEGPISTVNIKTSHGADTISFSLKEYETKHAISNSKVNFFKVEVLYNGQAIAEVDPSCFVEKPFDDYKKELLDAIENRLESNKNYKLQLDKDISVSWDKENKLTVYLNDSKIGPFSFEFAQDIQNFANELKKNDVYILHKQKENYIPIQPNSLAYTLAILTNPDMQSEQKGEMYVNPITHTLEEEGKSHIYAVHNNCGIGLYTYLPNQKDFKLCSFSSRNELSANSVCEIATCIQETSNTLSQIQNINISHKREEEKVENIVSSKLETEKFTPEILNKLFDKCKNEIEYNNKMNEKNLEPDFEYNLENEKDLENSINPSDVIPGFDEDLINLPFPSYDEEER